MQLLRTIPLLMAMEVAASPLSAQPITERSIRQNDFSCKSSTHPNPVVLLHALFVNQDFDLNFMEQWLRPQGFCTFSLTYGAYGQFPIAGLKPINESSVEIADFIKEVVEKTGAEKVDLVGHSEGGLQALYVPKFRGVSHLVDKIVAVAPPTHGTTVTGVWNLARALGKPVEDLVKNILSTVGCGACADVVAGGPAVTKLNDGTPIVQPGNTVTIIASRTDAVVTPVGIEFVDEPGVKNIFVQDYCPFDPVGHVSLAIDTNMWNLVVSALQGDLGRWFLCGVAPPVRH